jgi:hypothetical protein
MIEMAIWEQHDCIEAPETQDTHLNEQMTKVDQKKLKDIIKKEIQMDVMWWVILQPKEQVDQLPADSRASTNIFQAFTSY